MRVLSRLLYLSLAACVGALPHAAAAQTGSGTPADGLTLTASVRARVEVLDGQARTGLAAEDDVLSLRTLVALDYRDGPWRIGGEVQDARVYGADLGSAVSANDVNAIEPVQAYVAYTVTHPFGAGTQIELIAGRQTLNIGSRRLVAADDYRNTTNGYTGVRAEARLPASIRATAIYVLPQLRLPDDAASVRDNAVVLDRESFDLRLWGATVWRERALGQAMVEASYYRLDERDTVERPSRDRHLDTLGIRIIRLPAAGKIDFELEAIGQWGRVSSGLAANAATLDVAASFIHADVGVTFPGPARARLSVEYDRASGDGRGPGFGRFDTLFGMRRADLAPAGIYAQIGRANISTPGVRIEVAPTRRLDGFAVYRAMWLENATDAFSSTGVRDPGGRSGRFAGHQLEGRIRWWAVPERLRLEANAAFLAKGRFLEAAPNAGPAGDVTYLSIAATFSFSSGPH